MTYLINPLMGIFVMGMILGAWLGFLYGYGKGTQDLKRKITNLRAPQKFDQKEFANWQTSVKNIPQ